MAEHAGAAIFGGPMSANDEDEFVRQEIDWISVPLKEEKPFLGLCLGAQMMAKLMGARVYAHPEGRAEIGYFPLLPTQEGEAVADAPRLALAEPRLSLAPRGLRLPAGARMPRYRRRFPDPGDPGRPEGLRAPVPPGGHARHDVPLDGARAPHRLELPGAQDRSRQIEGRFMYDPHVAQWLDSLPRPLARRAEEDRPQQAPTRYAPEPLGRACGPDCPDVQFSAALPDQLERPAQLTAGPLEQPPPPPRRRSPGAGAPRVLTLPPARVERVAHLGAAAVGELHQHVLAAPHELRVRRLHVDHQAAEDAPEPDHHQATREG